MANRYKQPSLSSAVRFQRAPLADLEMSKMTVNPRVYTTYNAGDIVPVFYEEVLPHSTFSVDVDFINRLLSATIKPTMGSMQMDIYAYFVPNRIINDSWKNVQGENTSGYWSAPEVDLAPLYPLGNTVDVQIPVGSVADYYGLPTQLPVKSDVLCQCNDLKEKGYLSIYNNYFRDENYQPPINFSKLNVYQGFLLPKNSVITANGLNPAVYRGYAVPVDSVADGSYPAGAITKALHGEGFVGSVQNSYDEQDFMGARMTDWSALDPPLKANKLHDAFTSVLPSPQKGPEVFFGIADTAPVGFAAEANSLSLNKMLLSPVGSGNLSNGLPLYVSKLGEQSYVTYDTASSGSLLNEAGVTITNAYADLSQATGVSINDLRRAAAVQQVYEMLGRSGSRYLETLRAFFGIAAENPFKDIPTQLGHIRRELDLYQVAQTSGSVEGETPQGNLTGFGYTAKEGNLFTYTALEHGYVHFLVVVRNRNIYPSLMLPDNFRKSTLDWYLPQLANIGEQPVRLATLNPFVSESMEKTIGFQEAWWEYRYSPDRVSGYCRTGLSDSLDIWTYADSFDGSFTHVNGDWLKSNAQEVLDRTLAVTSAVSPQFLGMFEFKITKQIPMPIYSVPGLDVL